MQEHIELPTQPVRPERGMNAEESFKYLSAILKEVACDISKELRERFGFERLINDKCVIRMDPFHKINPNKLRSDKEYVKKREMQWAGIETQEPKQPLDPKEQKQIDAAINTRVQKWLEAEEKEKSKQLEMVVTILLHKAFGDKYIVVRSSKYDDYSGGVDNVIVNKETGTIICAVDDVRENQWNNDRESEKDRTILDKTRAGGAELIYGFTLDADRKIKLASLGNLPIFRLGLTEAEYYEIVNAVKYKSGETNELNETESKILEKILASIREQRDRLLADPEVQKQSGIVESLRKVQELVG
jgi:hypothetical protein